MPTKADVLRLARERAIGSPLLGLGLAIVVYALLVVFGVSTSSIGADVLREDPHHPHGIEIGKPQPIRSDEYMTESPISLGWFTAGGRDIDNPLSVPPNFFHQLPSGPVSGVVFFDGTIGMLGPLLPDSMLFAARWWLPTFLLFAGLPLWFRKVTGSARWGYLAAVVVVFSPSNMWWSGRPVNTLGFMFASAALMLVGHDLLRAGRKVAAVAAFVVSAILMARFPSYYQPFAIILGFPVLLSTVAFILAGEGERRHKLTTILTTGAIGGVFTVGTMLENLDSIRAGLDTVYPGKRISTGEALSFGKVFGAPVLEPLEAAQKTMSATNASEASSAFVVLLVVAALLWLARGWNGTGPVHWVLPIWMGIGAFWLAWCTVDLGSAGSHLPLANLVPAIRAANDVGFLGTIAFFVLLALWRPGDVGRWVPYVAAGVAGAVTLAAGLSWRANGIPGLSVPSIWLASAVTGVVLLLILRWPSHWVSWSALVASVVVLTIQVNPIEIGLADLRGTTTAQAMITAGREARDTGGLWVSDDPAFDALMFATGTPALSSRQQIGPNREEWLKLDPDGSHEEMWNRGGTFVRFRWTKQSGIAWENPFIDQVVMTMSPCTLASVEERLTHVVSHRPLRVDCLTLERTLRWSGARRYVYRVT